MKANELMQLARASIDIQYAKISKLVRQGLIPRVCYSCLNENDQIDNVNRLIVEWSGWDEYFEELSLNVIVQGQELKKSKKIIKNVQKYVDKIVKEIQMDEHYLAREEVDATIRSLQA